MNSRHCRLGAILALGLALGIGPVAAQTAQPDFHVGVVGALTGGFAAATKDSLEGFNGWIKTRGLPGRKVVVDVSDDQTNPVEAQTVFRRLAGDPDNKLIMMFSNSNAGLAIKPFASEYKVPIVSGGGADTLGFPADPWLFKVVPATGDTMNTIAAYARKMGYKKIAHIYSLDAFGQSDLVNMKAAVAKFGLDEVAIESFNIDDTNFTSQIAHLQAAHPDLIYSSASGRPAVLFFRQYKQYGLSIPLIETGAAINQAFFDGVGGADKADGLMSSVPSGVFGEAAGGQGTAYYRQFAQALGHVPTYLNTFGFDCGLITEAGVTRSDGSRQGIRDALEKLQDMPAINGLVAYRPDNHTGQDYRALAIGSLKNGIFQPALAAN